MHPSTKVVAIYRELRESVGAGASAAEILACAASLVELFSVEDGMPAFDLREGRYGNAMMPLDKVWADGGWGVLSREWGSLGWESSDGCGGVRPAEWVIA